LQRRKKIKEKIKKSKEKKDFFFEKISKNKEFFFIISAFFYSLYCNYKYYQKLLPPQTPTPLQSPFLFLLTKKTLTLHLTP
jgi:hypothetical protein